PWGDWITQVETLGARAAWALGEWPTLENFVTSKHMQARRYAVSKVVEGVDDCLVLEAVVAIQKGHLDQALALIGQARQKIAPGLSAVLGESYSRAYSRLLTVMSLTELEEVVDFKRVVRNARAVGPPPARSGGGGSGELWRTWSEVAEHRSNLRAKWSTRLQWVPEVVDVWKDILAVRSLVFKPHEDLGTWLKLASLARKHGRGELCANTLRQLGAQIPDSSDPSNQNPSQDPAEGQAGVMS
ncbi:unnamed protein product, partial [Discosporangium mesarthrocarpum]